MRDRFGLVLLVAMLGAFCSGCAETAPFKRVLVQGQEPRPYPFVEQAEWRGRCGNQDRANCNLAVLEENYRDEWKFHRHPDRRTGPPRLGVTLSGGGVRSASFTIGVLRALHELGVLDEADIMSSVSGGSYALYWYYMQHYYLDQVCGGDDDCYKEGSSNIFRSCYRQDGGSLDDSSFSCCRVPSDEPSPYMYQHHLESRADLLVRSINPGLQAVDYTQKVITWMPFSYPPHLLGNFLFNWDYNGSPFRRYYQNGIERTFGYVPKDGSLVNYVNADSLVFQRAYADPVQFDELRVYLEKNLRTEKPESGVRSLPFFVINTTANYGNTSNFLRTFGEFHDDLTTRVFEWTPLGYGSDSYGYRRHEPGEEEDVTVSKAVSISGAAPDIQFAATAVGVLNLNVGYHIPNWNVSRTERVFHHSLPFPLWLLNRDRLDVDSTSIYLSDGGHSDNLGLFSLVRRGVEKIIIVDAERDPQSGFGSAIKLQRWLRQELGVQLDIDRGLLDVFDTPDSVVGGTIRGLPIAGRESEEVEILYIKLSFDSRKVNPVQSERYKNEVAEGVKPTSDDSCFQRPALMEEDADEETGRRYYPCSVSGYWIRHRDTFPHQSTFDLEYSAQQFRAYRDLGYDVAMDGWEEIEALLEPLRPARRARR